MPESPDPREPILTPDTRVIATGRWVSTAIDDGTPGDVVGVVARLGATDAEASDAAHRIAVCLNLCRGYSTEQLSTQGNEIVVFLAPRDESIAGVRVLVDRDDYQRLRTERDAACHDLGLSAALINCQGPLHERITVLQTDHGRRVEGLEGQIADLTAILATAVFPGKSLGDDVLLYECAECHNSFLDEAFCGGSLASAEHTFASGAMLTGGKAFCADCADCEPPREDRGQ